MKRLLLMVATMSLIVAATAFAAPEDSEEGGEEEEEKTFTCTDQGDWTFCICETVVGCNDMGQTEECRGAVTCSDEEVTQYCTCSWDHREVGGTSRRPDAFTPAGTNAPTETNTRDRLGTRGSNGGTDGVVAPDDNNEGRRNETVRARRGTVPVQEDEAEDREGETENTPTRRDHRR